MFKHILLTTAILYKYIYKKTLNTLFFLKKKELQKFFLKKRTTKSLKNIYKKGTTKIFTKKELQKRN
jgi:hypothetical protein